ncbi:MAG: LysR family transcriptional regulator [Selenomonadaceae bacterium]|nr:LysR family transcriptional regulator [Selenomonadaceae bacterium]
MEIRQLEYFLMVSRVNSFTRAAERLYVSQPAVTNAVRSLEDELGIQLFDRSQKQALLTTEGKIFFAHVEQIMNGISNTLEEINSLKNLGTGIVNIGLTALGGIPSCVFLLKEFVEGYPNIKISVREDETEKLQKLLVEDKLDFAFVFSGKEKSTLAYLELPPQELALCCNRRHRFRRQNVLPLEELGNESLILPKTARDFFVDSNILRNVVAEISHVQTIKSLVSAGLGVSILPEEIFEQDDNLIAVALEPPIYLQPVIAYKKNRKQSHAAEAFLDSVRKELKHA